MSLSKPQQMRAESRAIDNLINALTDKSELTAAQRAYLKSAFLADLRTGSERLLDAAIKLEKQASAAEAKGDAAP